MKKYFNLILLSFLALVVFLFTFLKGPNEIRMMLYQITIDTSILAIVIHIGFLGLLILGLTIKNARNTSFSALMLLLSGIASIISIKYFVIPNIILFLTFFGLTLLTLIKKELRFDFVELRPVNKIIGSIAILFGFYYLHWVSEPIWINALLYSPLGIVNCPTMAVYCGFLCWLKKPGSLLLEFFVASITLFFGFFGIMRLGAYMDVVLIISSMFLIIRTAARFDYNIFFKF